MDRQLYHEETTCPVDFAAFYQRHRRSLIGMLRRRFGDRADIEDVVHDAVTTALSRLNEYQPDRATMLTWVGRIAQNRMLDVLRSQKHALPSFDDPDFAEAEMEQAVGPEEDWARRQALNLLRALLSALPERQRRVIEAVQIEERTLRSAAEHLGLTMDKVVYALKSGMATLKMNFLSQNPGPFTYNH
jgi:RNA polymerase sigma-70 factor, ECF subfamily